MFPIAPKANVGAVAEIVVDVADIRLIRVSNELAAECHVGYGRRAENIIEPNVFVVSLDEI